MFQHHYQKLYPHRYIGSMYKIDRSDLLKVSHIGLYMQMKKYKHHEPK